jgi:hypothetical protein
MVRTEILGLLSTACLSLPTAIAAKRPIRTATGSDFIACDSLHYAGDIAEFGTQQLCAIARNPRDPFRVRPLKELNVH